MEDALNAHQRPKLEVYDDSLFVVLKPVVYEPESDTVTAGELMVFIGDSFVVTVRHGEGTPLAPCGSGWRPSPRSSSTARRPCCTRSATRSSTTTWRWPASSRSDLEELEADVFAPPAAAPRNTAARIYTFKRQVLEFRRATGPLAEPMARLASAGVPFVHEHAQPFFRDVSDHLTRANEQVEGLDRLLSDILSAHLAQMGVRQNDDMRKISAWAAMAAVPTMVAGIYGMNFEHMPELQRAWAYPAVLR